jgi:GTP-binding protein HflX
VLNKADLLGGVSNVPGLVEDRDTIAISALNGDGLDALRAAIDERLASAKEVASFQLVPSDGAKLAWLYRHGEVLTREDEEEAIRVTVRMLPADRARFESLV